MANTLNVTVDQNARESNGPGSPRGVGDWSRIVRAEYGEMPGLSLTQPQVERLWQLRSPDAHALLDQLVSCGFLCCTHTGRYVRADLTRN